MRYRLILSTVGMLACVSTGPDTSEQSAAGSGPLLGEAPPTEQKSVIDTYHGVEVKDPFRWLEDAKAPEVKQWSDAQNQHARAYLNKLPGIEALRKRTQEILQAKSASYWGLSSAGGKLMAMKHQPPKQQPMLIVIDDLARADQARPLVDPNALDPSGGTHIDWYVPSPNGAMIAVSLSKGGTESGDVHVYEVATGKRVHEIIKRVNGGTAGGDLAWAADSSGFFYTRYPREGERPAEDLNFFQQLYYHQLGKPESEDRYELGKELPRIAEIQLAAHAPSGRLLVTVQKGDGGEFSHYLREKNGKYRQFSKFGDKTLQATFGPRDDLYVLSRASAPRGKLLRVPVKTLDVIKGQVIIPESEDTIVEDFWGPPSILATANRLYVLFQLGGPSQVRVYDLDGKPQPAPEQLPISQVSGLTPISGFKGAGGDDILFRNLSYVQPPAWYRFDAKTNKTQKTAFFSESPVDFSGAEVVREFATSKDGTKIPVNIVRPKGLKLDGSHPTLLYGYGGYGVNLQPRFRAANHVLLSSGVVYAVANLRGGGEYGEAWHRAGNLTNKQNVFDDFAAAAQHLLDRKYTNTERLGIMGGSNGGLLMGATLTQHPKRMKAVISLVGIYDMLRVELSPNGAFNIPEFGTVKKEDHFKAMYAYSPYHNVKPRTAYPATLFMTGANDPRVDPMQSRKMTAMLQSANSASTPILLRTTDDSGHGGGTKLSERIAQLVHMYAFLFHELGVEFQP